MRSQTGYTPGAMHRVLADSDLVGQFSAGREVVEFLLERGVDSRLRNAGGQTGLHRAAYGAHVAVVELLLQHGFPVDVKDNDFRATPLDVALYIWDTSPDTAKRERCYEVIILLARAGSKLDPEQWHDPNDDRPSILEKIRSDSRMLAALRGEIDH